MSTFTFIFTSDLGAGVTVTFTGRGVGHAATNATGTAAYTVSTGFVPTGTVQTEQESAAGGGCSAGPVSYTLPNSPSG